MHAFHTKCSWYQACRMVQKWQQDSKFSSFTEQALLAHWDLQALSALIASSSGRETSVQVASKELSLAGPVSALKTLWRGAGVAWVSKFQTTRIESNGMTFLNHSILTDLSSGNTKPFLFPRS